jgi:hypothetical protein
MGDSDYLSPTDLIGFHQTVQAQNPWGIGGQILGQWQPNVSTWNATESGAGNFGKAFLAGLMSGYARQDANAQLGKVVTALPQLASNPMGTAVPEGVDADAFSVLRGSAALKNTMRQAAIGDQLAAKGIFLDQNDPRPLSEQVAAVLGKQKAAETKGAIQGQLEGYGIDAGGTGVPGAEKIPGSPLYEKNKDQTTLERQLANDFYTKAQDFKYKEQGIKALSQAYLDTSGTSDFELIRRGSQMVEPGLAVRRDDEDSIRGAASILGVSFQTVKNAITGETRLPPDVRAGIMRIAKRSYDASLGDYNTIRQSYLDRASAAGVDPLAVVPFDAGRPFEDLYPDLRIGSSSAAVLSDAPGVSADQTRRIIADAKMKYGDTPKAKEVARQAIEALKIPSRGGAPLG